jgi:hypothetical protein
MPKKLDRCVAQVKKQGKNESSAYAICTNALKKAQKATKPKGKKYA